MKYMGSKQRHGDAIYATIKKHLESRGFDFLSAAWVEPFVGGANMMSKIQHTKKRFGHDINEHLIEMFRELQRGWLPPTSLSEVEYQRLRAKSKAEKAEAIIGFAGIGCSYAGKWFGGYARGNTATGLPRNYCLESRNNVLRQMKSLEGVKFTAGDYRVMQIGPAPSVVYCDPPYQETTKYKNNFDSLAFWAWCESLCKQGHQVFVSEYAAPNRWVCLWEKSRVASSLTKDTGSKTATEKLFGWTFK